MVVINGPVVLLEVLGFKKPAVETEEIPPKKIFPSVGTGQFEAAKAVLS